MNTTKNTILAQATRTFPAPKGYRGQLIVTAQAYQLGGNKHPHFSVTGEISTASERSRGNAQCGGCLHEYCLAAWPVIARLVRLHLSNADDGEPMHGEANGFHWLAGAVEGNFGQRYHGGNSPQHFPIQAPEDQPWKTTEYRNPTHDEALSIMANHLRITTEEAQAIRRQCVESFHTAANGVASSPDLTEEAHRQRTKAGSAAAKATFAAIVEAMRPRWRQEAQDGMALLRALSSQPEQAAA